MAKTYTVSDGTLMLILEEAEEGGFVVSSPLDPGLFTQGETLQDSFRMAYDALEGLKRGRESLAMKLQLSEMSATPPTKRVRKSRPTLKS